MKCHAEDAMENAIGMNWYDPCSDTWDTDEHKKIVESTYKCQVTDEEYNERKRSGAHG